MMNLENARAGMLAGMEKGPAESKPKNVV